MATLAFYGSCRPSLLRKAQMAPLALAMVGVLHIQAGGFRPQAVAGLTFFNRQSFMPEVASALVLVMALGARHSPGFVGPVAELHRRLLS